MIKRTDYSLALQRRLSGETYGEIRTALDIPKSTLSTWFRLLVLPQKARAILRRKSTEGIKALGKFNEQRTVRILEENSKLQIQYKQKIGKLTSRELMIIGASLYWAEGYKNFNNKRKHYPYVSFSNSDPVMIRLFLQFLNDTLLVSQNNIWACVMGYPNTDSTRAILYWKKITGLSKNRFRFYSALSSRSNGVRPKNLLPYGTLQLRINKRQDFFKIKGLIDGIIKNI